MAWEYSYQKSAEIWIRKKDPGTKTYETFKAAVNIMLHIILMFCRAVSTTTVLFLRCFQSEKPNAFFLYEKIGGIMLIVVERFVRSEVLSANSSPIKLLRINLDHNEFFYQHPQSTLVLVLRLWLKKKFTVNQTKVKNFYYMVKVFLKTIVEKLRERSPLKYKLTRAVSSLSPTQISTLSEAIIQTI